MRDGPCWLRLDTPHGGAGTAPRSKAAHAQPVGARVRRGEDDLRAKATAVVVGSLLHASVIEEAQVRIASEITTGALADGEHLIRREVDWDLGVVLLGRVGVGSAERDRAARL